MEVEDKRRMAKRILGEYPEEHAAVLEFVERFADLQETPAQFQERCGQIALARFWREQHGEPVVPVHEMLKLGHVTPPSDTHVTNGKSHETVMVN